MLAALGAQDFVSHLLVDIAAAKYSVPDLPKCISLIEHAQQTLTCVLLCSSSGFPAGGVVILYPKALKLS